MRSLLTLLLLGLSVIAFAQTTTFELTESVYFATAESRLDRDTRARIDDFRQQLSAYADFSLRLEAFTDERGATDYNEELAADRAAAVRTYLEAAGVAAGQWTVSTFGERRARQGTTDEAELRADRRVDIVATVTGWVDTEAALAALRKDQVQTFTTDAAEDYVVRGKRGGRFLLAAGSLVYADGTPATGPVTLRLTEAYTFDDMLIAGLTTHSGDRLLETGGMFSLTATDAEGNPLQLADGKNIPSSIPTNDFNEQMRIFAGREHDEEGGNVDWELTPGTVSRSWRNMVRSFGPFLTQMGLNSGNKMEAWLRQNPEPEIEPKRSLPRERAVPVYPDTSSIAWEPRGLDKIFASKKTRAERTQRKIDGAKAQYARDVKNRERSIRLRADNAAFNAGREERFAAAHRAWEQARDAYREELAADTKAMNEAFRKDYEKRREAYRAKREAELASALTDDNLDGQRGNLDRYFFTVTQLGWVNCDVFYNEEDPIEVLAAAPTSDRKTTVVLIPEDRNAVLAYAPKEEGSWGCAGVPRGKGYTLIAYQIREGRIEYAQQRVAAADEEPEQLEFRPVGVEELRELLGEFGKAK